MADVVDVVAAQLEKVRPMMQEINETSNQISALFKKNTGEVSKITRWLYRWPVLIYRGGAFAKYSPNGGTLPVGTGMKATYLQAGFIYTIMMFRVSDEQLDSSDSSEQSVINVLSDTLANATIEYQVHDDMWVHQDGTGILTNPASATNGTTTLTFTNANDYLRTNALHAGMDVDVWDSTGATIRAGGPYRIESIDDQNHVVTFNKAVTGIQDTDIITFAELDSYGPSTLVTGQSGWPALNAQTDSGGLQGDSFRHGIRHYHDSSTANYTGGKLKSTLPTMVAIEVPCGGKPLTFQHGLSGQAKVRRRRTNDEAKNLTGIFPEAQRAAIQELGIAISQVTVSGTQFGESKDLSPSNTNYTDTFQYCGMTCYISKRQPADRVDFVNFKNWTRVSAFPGVRPYRNAGRTQFEGRDTNGLITAITQFGWQSAEDLLCYDPGAEFYITGPEVPAGYV